MGKICFLSLTNGHSCKVDSKFFNYLNQWKWYLSSTNIRRTTKRDGKLVLLHREILHCPKGFVVDHMDGDITNNTLSNLRICTQQNNATNSKKYKNNKSGYRGVSFNEKSCKSKPWLATIGKNYEKIYIGNFKTAEEASLAYSQHAQKLFGEFFRTN